MDFSKNYVFIMNLINFVAIEIKLDTKKPNS
jgi:hypothetical protein